MDNTVTADTESASSPTGQFEWVRAFRTAKLPGSPAYARQLRVAGLTVASYTNQHGYVGPQHSPSTFTLAEALCLSSENRGPAIQAVKHLETLGWLAIVSGGGKKVRNSYQLTVPAELAAKTEECDHSNCELFSGNCELSAANCEAQGLTQPQPSNHNNLPTPAAAGGEGGSSTRKDKTTTAPPAPKAAASVSVEELLGEEFPRYLGALTELRNTLDTTYHTGEGTRLFDGVQAAQFTRRNDFARVLVWLLASGWAVEAWEELTRCDAGFRSPYTGATNIAAVAWNRLRDLYRATGGNPKGEEIPVDQALAAPAATLLAAARIGSAV